MKFKIILVLLGGLVIFSCQKDIEETKNPILECIGEATVPNGGNTCADPKGFDNFFCDRIYFGAFELEESSKLFMPQYCLNEGDSIVFESSDGKFLNLLIENKRFYKSNILYNSFLHCKDDSVKYMSLCIYNENLAIKLKSTVNDLTLDIMITTEPDIYDSNLESVGDVLQIARQLTITKAVRELSAIINSRTLNHSVKNDQEFYEKIILKNKTYNNVISNDRSHLSNPGYKYYYNTDYGLIGFVDESNKLWTLVE